MFPEKARTTSLSTIIPAFLYYFAGSTSPLGIIPNFVASFIGTTITGWIFGSFVAVHALESLYTVHLCRKHSTRPVDTVIVSFDSVLHKQADLLWLDILLRCNGYLWVSCLAGPATENPSGPYKLGHENPMSAMYGDYPHIHPNLPLEFSYPSPICKLSTCHRYTTSTWRRLDCFQIFICFV